MAQVAGGLLMSRMGAVGPGHGGKVCCCTQSVDWSALHADASAMRNALHRTVALERHPRSSAACIGEHGQAPAKQLNEFISGESQEGFCPLFLHAMLMREISGESQVLHVSLLGALTAP